MTPSKLSVLVLTLALVHSAASQRHSESSWLDAINPLRWFSSETDLSVNAGGDDDDEQQPRRRQVLNEQILRRIGQSESDFTSNSGPRTRRRDSLLPALAAQRRAINVADGGKFKEHRRPEVNDPSAGSKDYSIGVKDYTVGTKVAPPDYPTDHIPDLIMSEYWDQKYGKVARPTAECVCRCDCCDCCPCNGNDLHYVDR